MSDLKTNDFQLDGFSVIAIYESCIIYYSETLRQIRIGTSKLGEQSEPSQNIEDHVYK